MSRMANNEVVAGAALSRVMDSDATTGLTDSDMVQAISASYGSPAQPAPAVDATRDKGYDAKNGVRPLRRLIQDTVEDYLAVELLEGHFAKGTIVQISVKNGELTYAPTTEND